MKCYERYKKTGNPWINEIPSGWNLIRISSVFKERAEKVSDKDFPPLSVTKKGIVPQLADAAKSDDHDNRKKICKGDFVINSRSDRKGSSGLSAYEGSCSLINIVLEPTGISAEYVGFLLKSVGFQEEFYRNGTGIVADLWSTNYQKLKCIQIPLPSDFEQKKIADFLYRKTNKIDNVIKLLGKKKELLVKAQNAYIKKLVQYGVFKYELKANDNYVFEKMPKSWDRRYLSQVTRENKQKNTGLKNTKLLSLSYGKIVEKDINTTDGLLPASFESYQILEPGMIVLRLTDLQNDHKSLRVGLCKTKGIITSAYIGLELTDEVCPEYMYYLLHTYDICKGFYGMGGGVRQSLNYKGLCKMELPFPPLEEQKIIAEKISDFANKVEAELECLKRKIAKLESLKQSLISEVVTGQIDVRDFEIPEEG